MEIVFRVRQIAGGWIVEQGRQIGGVMDRQTAVDMAQDMVAVIRRTGGLARVEVDGVRKPT